MIMLALGIVGGSLVAAGAVKAAYEAGVFGGGPYRARQTPPPRVGYS